MEKPTPLRSVPASHKPARPLPRQLEAVRERSTKAFVEHMRTFLDGIDDKLFDLSEGAADTERNQLLDAMREVRIKRSGIETRFQQELANYFQVLTQESGDAKQGKADAPSLENLALVNDDDLEIDVAIDNMARRTRNGCDEQLRAFSHRLEYLFEGRVSIGELNSPLEPRQVGRAFQKSMETLELDIRTRLVLLKLFEREVLQGVDQLVGDANQQLIDAGVLPEMKAVPVQSRAPKRNAATATTKSSISTEEASTQMFGMLQEMMSAMRSMAVGGAAGAGGGGGSGSSGSGGGSGGGGAALPGPSNMAVMQNGVAYVGGAPVAAGTAVHAVSSDDLLGMLNRLQRVEQSLDGKESQATDEANVKEGLSGLMETEHQGQLHALEQADDDVINLVSMLFDFILDDQALPTAIKALLGRLQIPLLKVAIIDKNFFTNDEHPARQLLNALARAGGQWSPQQGTNDALYKLVESSVYRILDNYDLDVGLFEELLQTVNDYVAQQTQQSERVEARVREVEEGRAQAELASRTVDKELDKRLAGRSLPDVAVKILRQAWRQVLSLTFLREGPDSEVWQKQLKVADAVVWSLLPNADEASRERLRSVSPRLITSLDQGLLSVNYDPVERQTLMAALRQAHMTLLQGQESARAAVAPVVPVDTHPATTLPPGSPLIKEMTGLSVGQWLEIGGDADAQRCKLAANIRQGTKLVFTNRRGIKVVEFSAIELAEKVHRKEARLLESGALFDRALESVIGDLRRHMRG